MPKSISYHSSLIKRLQEPEYAAEYLSSILTEPEVDWLKRLGLKISF